MATKSKPMSTPKPKREFTLKQLKEQQLQVFEEQHLKIIEHEENLSLEQAFKEYMFGKQENYKQQVEEYKQYLQQIETQDIFMQIPVEQIAFTTCRICQCQVIWGAQPPTNCAFCGSSMKLY